MTPTGHAVLIVEDDPAAQELLREVVASRGDRPHVVGTVADAVATMAAQDFCYFLFDQELPDRPGARALVGGGEQCMTVARKRDGRRNDAGFHVTPIFVVTGYASDPDFVGKMYDLGTDAFMAKPLKGREEVLLDKIRTCLGRGGRGDHDACASLALPDPGVAAREVRVIVDGTKTGRRTSVTINGQRRDLPDAIFAVFLRLACARTRGDGGWSSRDALGLGESRHVLSRLRSELEGLLPGALDLVESDHSKNFRLNPAVVIESVDWERLEKHPDPAVQKVAKGARGRS